MAERKVLCLHSISIRGFKSFKEKAKIGPLTGFSCIIGPNGAGKSVVGEALAFAFGGLTRTMRARNAAGLLNYHLKKQGTSTSAKVSVTLLLTGQESIKISRLLTGTRSQYFLKTDGIRRELQLNALKAELALLGIDVSATDRFLVMQNHQVVKARHPLELSKHLEWLTGAGHYEERINEVDEKISKFTSENTTLQDFLSEVQLKRQKLAPVVERWQKYNKEWQDFVQKKVTFLRRQEKFLRDQLQNHLTEEEQLSTEHRNVEQKRDRIEVAISEMKSRQKELEFILRDKSKIASAAAKKKESYRLQVVKAKVRLEEARKESSRQKLLQESEAAELMKQKHVIEEELRIKELMELQPHMARLANQKLNLDTGMENSIQQTLSKAEAEHQLLLSRIARLQEILEDAEKRKMKYASRASELEFEVTKLRDEISKCTTMVEKQQLERQSFKKKMEYLEHEIHLSSSQTLPGIRGQFAAVQLRLKKYKKVQDLKSQSGKHSREDEAANFLKGKLQCRLLGRLADLATVHKDTVVAVNAVLCHFVNMATTFVTEDRAASNEIISYFQANRIGVATCEILAESTNLGANQYRDPQSLLRYIQCKENIRGIFTKYLCDWLVVPDRNAAVSYLRQRNCQGNVVTLSGDIFNQDGEIIRAQSNKHGRHLLRAIDTEMRDPFGAEPVEIGELNIKDLLHQKSVLEAKVVAQEEKLAEYLKEKRTLQEQLQLSAQNESTVTCSLAILQAKLKNTVAEASSAQLSLQKVISDDGLKNELAQLLVCKQDHERSLSELRASLSPKDNASIVEMQVKMKTTRRNHLRKQLDDIVSQISSDSLHEEINLVPLEKALNEGKLQLDEGAVEYTKRASELEATKQDLSSVEENINIHSRKASNLKKKQVFIANKLEELQALQGSMKSNLEKVLTALSETCGAQISKRTCFNENDMEDNSFNDEGEYLAQEEKLLMEERRTIDAGALEEDVVCKKKESSLAEEMKVLTELLKAEALLKDELESKRFTAFREAMIKVNDCLSKIYRSLTKHGDAYLTYTEEKSLLFVDGVHFHVRPDRHKWRNFSSLSGGQQALAGLALSFSLQLAYPSPFYFFDEIDASLDTKNARLVAEYIQSMGSAQYILVSHRPQLYELASTLVGIYHFHNGSACITVSPTNKAQQTDSSPGHISSNLFF